MPRVTNVSTAASPPLSRARENEWHLELDLPARQQRPFDGAGHLGRAAIAPLVVEHAQLELTLDDRASRGERIEERDVLKFVLGVRGNGGDDEHDDQGETQETMHAALQLSGWPRRPLELAGDAREAR